MTDSIKNIITAHKQGQSIGIYSICSSNRFVLEAAMLQARNDDSTLLIESTSNQVNQTGGYTGMRPRDFVQFVRDLAKDVKFPLEKIIFGGDHLGPNVWRKQSAPEAMSESHELVREYIRAGYGKIHLDLSMPCLNDPVDNINCLPTDVIAKRTAELCKTCEEIISNRSSTSELPLYIIGSDVPPPGGQDKEHNKLTLTKVEDVKQTIAATRDAFSELGLDSAWGRVIAVVVQPGVDFSDCNVSEYNHNTARSLSEFIEDFDHLVYEAHSTDYQTRHSLRQMVKDHFAILKVGPGLTFAFREAVFALANMENEWLGKRKSVKLSQIQQVVDKVMRANPVYWQQHYDGSDADIFFSRNYSYSDRVRYYWPDTKIDKALKLLLTNLLVYPVPMSLISMYLPNQYQAVREHRITSTPVDLIYSKIGEVLEDYAYAVKDEDQNSGSSVSVVCNEIER